MSRRNPLGKDLLGDAKTPGAWQRTICSNVGPLACKSSINFYQSYLLDYKICYIAKLISKIKTPHIANFWLSDDKHRSWQDIIDSQIRCRIILVDMPEIRGKVDFYKVMLMKQVVIENREKLLGFNSKRRFPVAILDR